MKILGYDEVDGQQVLELNIKGFEWFLSPDQIKTIRNTDSRTPDYVALYAVEGDKVQGQVGVITLDTQTAERVEKIGYIWGVATRPSVARCGYAKKLMKQAHERLIGEGVRYSFLGTGKSLVAYDLYKKLGYKEFTMLKRGLKKCQKKESGGITFKAEADNDVIANLFYEYSKDLLGFVKRPRNFMEVRKAWSWFQYDLVGAFYEDETPVGYVIANKEDKLLKIWELCCPKKEDLEKCILALESHIGVEHIVLELVHKSVNEDQFMETGFKVFDESWGILMLNDLKGGQSLKEIRKIYGIENKKFHMTPVDEY